VRESTTLRRGRRRRKGGEGGEGGEKEETKRKKEVEEEVADMRVEVGGGRWRYIEVRASRLPIDAGI